MKKLIALASVVLLIFLAAAPAYAADIIPPAQPVLTLKVTVDETCKTNVRFEALLNGSPVTFGSDTAGMIDFYTGSPMLCVYPNIYLGSAPVGPGGVAEFGTWQEAGSYAGGAIYKSALYGTVFSNVVMYEVKKLPPAQPVLKLEAKVIGGISANKMDNVQLTATLILPDGYVDMSMSPLPPKVDFYSGNPLVDMYPNELLGSAFVVDGVAKLNTALKPGDYALGAACSLIPGGRIYAPQVYVSIPKLALNIDLKVDVASGAKAQVTLKAAVRVVELKPVTGTAAATVPSGPLKIDFYVGDPRLNMPLKYAGSAMTDRSGNAFIVISQAPGTYAAYAVCETNPYGTFASKTVNYRVSSSPIVPVFFDFWQRFFKLFSLA